MKAIFTSMALALALTTPFSASVQAGNLAESETLFGVQAVDNLDLEATNGRQGLSLADSDLDAVHGYNEANRAVSGSAGIGPGALSEFSGAAAVVVNSGHNSVVQVSQQIIFNLY